MKNKNKKWCFYTLGKICMHFSVNSISDSVFFNPRSFRAFQKLLIFEKSHFVSAGIFSAPVAGLYYFTFFYHAGGEHPSKLFLMKNCETIVMTHDHKSRYDTADNGGNAAFLQLKEGDQVFVRLVANTHVWGSSQTNFSGFLVRHM